jgi:hypothetical protein
VKKAPDTGSVPEIDLMNGHIARDRGDILAFNQRIVVVVEIVQKGDFLALPH